jgi:hypothetical protein
MVLLWCPLDVLLVVVGAVQEEGTVGAARQSCTMESILSQLEEGVARFEEVGVQQHPTVAGGSKLCLFRAAMTGTLLALVPLRREGLEILEGAGV